MKTKTKQLLFFCVAIFSLSFSKAQFKIPGLGNPDVHNALEKVIADFPKEFANLKGDVLTTNPQTVEYASLLDFKSAEQNTITQYSGRLPVYSWQALMFTTEEFETAAKNYKALYSQLKGMTLTLNRDYTYNLSGEYDKPDESKKFSTTLFRLIPNASNLPKLKVELLMQYELLEWKIYLLVYQKEREDNEKGRIRD
ncbi:MAG: hypothetical protein M3Y85_06335 [Bacteroidota bacterium]|nr:hypothetical protein [Bacteroidota bacterium]